MTGFDKEAWNAVMRHQMRSDLLLPMKKPRPKRNKFIRLYWRTSRRVKDVVRVAIHGMPEQW